MINKKNILFICGRNKKRSKTAEIIYKQDCRVNVRSAGISESSTHHISEKDILWADLILVFERRYKDWIVQNFSIKQLPPISSLDITDNYRLNDPTLIELIREKTENFINN